ncbi:MAG: glutaredoxin family protein [Anaerolineae bacterium]
MVAAASLRKRYVTLYVTSWCFASRRARTLLERLDVPHKSIDIEQDPDAAQRVEELNGGYRSVPTILIELVLAQPDTDTLQSVLLSSGARLVECTAYVRPDSPDCAATLEWFRTYHLACHAQDVGQNPSAEALVREWTGGAFPLPTLHMTLQLTEPTSDQLQAAVAMGG